MNGRTVRRERTLSDTFHWTPPTLEIINEEKRAKNNFLMDFENYVLSLWDGSKGIPTGPQRFEDEEWAALMKTHLEFSDTCWDEYVAWCRSGGGDDWFQPDSECSTRSAAGSAARPRLLGSRPEKIPVADLK